MTSGFVFEDFGLYSVAEVLAEQQRRRYRGGRGDWWDVPTEAQLAGFEAFCVDHVLIDHPRGKRPFRMRPEQLEVVESYIRDPQTLSLKARQIGFTTVTMAFCLWRMLFFDDFSIIMLSKKEEDAKAALRMVVLAYNELSPEAREMFPKRLDRGATRFTCDNGSWMESHPAANNPARGRSASLMILDEWAFMPNPDEAWAATKPVTDIGGRIAALSTANGWGTTFHSTWVKAVAGDNSFHPLFFPWWAVPERDPEGLREDSVWYQQQVRDYLPWQLAQEFPSDPEDAFIRSGNPVFDTDVLQAIECEMPGWSGSVVGGELVVAEGGSFNAWALPDLSEEYVVGVDVAEGLEHGDYSSVHVIEVATGRVVATWHDHIDPDLLGDVVAEVGGFYNQALVGVEVNNHGLTTVKSLQRLGYGNLFVRRRLGTRREVIGESLGWLTTRQSKPFIIDSLHRELRSGGLSLFDRGTVQELIQYQRNADGSTEGSPHDDRVMSLAIANEMRRHIHARAEAAPKGGPPKGSILWEIAEMDREAKARGRSAGSLGRFNVRSKGDRVGLG